MPEVSRHWASVRLGSRSRPWRRRIFSASRITPPCLVPDPMIGARSSPAFSAAAPRRSIFSRGLRAGGISTIRGQFDGRGEIAGSAIGLLLRDPRSGKTRKKAPSLLARRAVDRDEHPPADHPQASLEEKLHGLRVGPMLLLEDPLRERLYRVFIEQWNAALEDDRTMIDPFVHEVDRAAGEADAVIESLFLGVEAREGRQQGRVDVHHPTAPLSHEPRSEDPLVTRQADE